ncbi:MAG: glycosyltransferase family 87 protein [Bacteroidales bacterium]|nr:glycosyltransferase family 87 protein [Bacteroidales bacterium]
MNRSIPHQGYTIFVALLCLLTLVINMINGRFLLGDLQVYYSAAENLFAGGQVYQISFYTVTGFYKYSPAVLFIFLPYTLLPFKVTAVIHFLITGIALWYLFPLINNLLKKYMHFIGTRHETFLLSLAFCCILMQVARELYLGNINILLLVICCLSLLQFLEGEDVRGGILLGIAALAKPYLLILILPLILRKNRKALIWLALTVLVVSAVPFIYPGPSAATDLYRDWWNTMMMHSEGYPGMTSLDYVAGRHLPGWPEDGILLADLAVIALVVIFILNNIRREHRSTARTEITHRNFTYEWILLLSLLPNLISADWVQMLFAAPLITFMIFHVATRKQYWWIPVLLPLLFFFGANSDDLLGRELSREILHSGWMGLSHFLLVIVSFIMFRGAQPSGHSSS